MSKNKVSGFEIPVSNFKELQKFYDSVFDWKWEMLSEEGAMAITTESDKEFNPTEPGGINGGFYPRASKDQRPSIIVETDSIDETLKAVEKAGGKILNPKHSLGDDWGWMADIADPEGNELTLMEKAKK